MKLDTEFIRLPLDFDVERLRQEVLAVPESSWRPHPQGHPGNSALPLIAAGGDPMNDTTRGPMAPTPNLEGCEYLQQVLASFGTVIGRARLMRLDGNSEATLHVDTNYYWAERVRIHVPIVTSDSITFQCGEQSVHMPPGQSWIFDAWRRHNVLNPTGDRRIHLVADTVGSAQFWDLVSRGTRPFAPDPTAAPFTPQLVPHRPGEVARVEIEQHNFPPVMTPWELETLVREVVYDGLAPRPGGTDADVRHFRGSTDAMVRQWRAVWARYGGGPEGLSTWRSLLAAYERGIEAVRGRLVLPNGTDPVGIAHQLIIESALDEQLLAREAVRPQAAPATTRPRLEPAAAPRPARHTSRFDRPIFIVAPPRSGTTLLFETLSRSPSVWTIGDESHRAIESIAPLHPGARGWDSNRLGASDARPDVLEALEGNFLAGLRDRDGHRPADDAHGLRLLEKTPKNSLRVPFLDAAYPDARFVYVQRDPRESLSSMIAAWESGRFVTYPGLPGWTGRPWSMLLTPEWRKLADRELAEVVAEQWRMTSEILIADLERLSPERWGVVGYHDLVADPQGQVERLCGFLDIEWDEALDQELPLSRYTLTAPKPEKWRQHADQLERVLPATAGVARRGRELLARPVTLRSRIEDGAPDPTSPYRSVSAGNLPEILTGLGATLLASTYQTGKLVAVRALGNGLNTHFRPHESPMGIAYQDGRLAVGTHSQMWEYQNLPQLTSQLTPPDRHDACFVPRSVSYTGDIRVHDVAWAGDELWMVATRFSCLATLDGQHSFVPRWKPPFVSAIAAEDRCHLNGMAVVDDRVRYVTALGVSDEPQGWRDHKADGGVIIDVDSGEVVVSGLSMPHSPRWHRDQLWVLESGQGSLARVDLEAGTVETVAELPGFTRGLAFAGPLAFVGLSEVREATTFGGLPLTARLEDRQCGIWVVNIETGETVAYLRFEDVVEEIFDVTLLPGMRFPELAEHGSDLVNGAFVVPPEALVG
ncbi:TIGR03032 family protein [Nocardioides hankookensis]|uniref:TIGR03032 family protein n=1 Tax=Nocardioides hankookensis TaxID=443157 RepID=A0ABW1LCX3_9ACTN